jgi:GH24 family phage-related lysozyme (muramidase)
LESLRLKPYDDQTEKDITLWVRGATIGYGHLIAKAEWPTYKAGITGATADSLLTDELDQFELAVGDRIHVRLQQYEFDAMVLFAYNIGLNGFGGSSVVKLINDPKAVTSFTTLEEAWKAWNQSHGKVMKGLERRRDSEWKIYTRALYEHW